MDKRHVFGIYLTLFVILALAFMVTSYWNGGLKHLVFAIVGVLLTIAFAGPVVVYALLHQISINVLGGWQVGPKSERWERCIALLLIGGLPPGYFLYRSAAWMWR